MNDFRLAQQRHAEHVADRDAPVTVVAFHTPDYDEDAALLRASLDAVGMTHEIVSEPDRGGWDANTAYKADFLHWMRSTREGPLVYLDADAFVHENCEDYFRSLHHAGVDFGAHFYAGPPKGYEARKRCACLAGKPCNRPHRMLSGTLFIGDTEPAHHLLDVWMGLNESLQSVGWGSGGGQRNLWAVVESQRRHLNIERMPGRYTYVFDRPESYPEGEPCIIEHLMASHERRGPRPFQSTRQERISKLREKAGLP